MQAIQHNPAVALENLENRTLLSGSHHATTYHATAHRTVTPAAVPAPKVPAVVMTPLTVSQTTTQLTITGTTGNDQIAISQSANTYTIKNGSWSTTVTGSFKKLVVNGNGGSDSIIMDKSVMTDSVIKATGAGSDTITGGSGNDSIYGGTGTNVINAGAGDDTIVTLGSVNDTVTGGLGKDSFWMDNSKTEVVSDQEVVEARNVHRVTNFVNFNSGKGSTAIGKTGGTALPEPAMTDKSMTYKSFASSPLFSDAGPVEDDIAQGYTGDCFFLSTLASVAKINPGLIRNMVVDLGDGTFAVQFSNTNGTQSFVRVDANFATWGGSSLAYANLGKGGSLWVAVIEKAFTEYRWSTGNATTGFNYASYGAIDGGWMDESYNALGCKNVELSSSSAADLANQIAIALAAGKSVTFAVGNPPTGANLIGDHAYTVDHVNRDGKGAIVSITLRNPWGVDGYSSTDGANDGYVTVTTALFFKASIGAVAGNMQ